MNVIDTGWSLQNFDIVFQNNVVTDIWYLKNILATGMR